MGLLTGAVPAVPDHRPEAPAGRRHAADRPGRSERERRAGWREQRGSRDGGAGHPDVAAAGAAAGDVAAEQAVISRPAGCRRVSGPGARRVDPVPPGGEHGAELVEETGGEVR